MTRNALLRKQLLWALALFVAISLLQWVAPYLAPSYASVFGSLQTIRCAILGRIPFSLGDLLYALGLLWLLIKTIRFFRKKKQERLWLPALLSVTCIGLSLYLIITLLWGVLYEQPKLSRRLSLQDLHELSNEELISFDSTLIQRLNYYEPLFRTTTLSNCGKELSATYRLLGFRIPLSVKPSIMGNGLAYWGVSGYYNPFTGEAQVNAQEPDFMLPFVAAHEMAHQTGIAAEDDANLMAYIACVENGSNNARFSAYFNIWLYAHRKVRRIDSNVAGRLKLQLHPGTLHRIDILRARDERFHTWLDDVSTIVFDLYLKMGNQQDGIQSYRNVAWSALAWEKSKRKKY